MTPTTISPSSQTTTTTTHKPRIRYLGGTRFLVESKTRPGIGHQVDTLRLRCGCEAGSYNRRCWHLAAALQYEAWRTHQAARAHATAGSQQQPAPAPAAPMPAQQQRAEGVALWSFFE